MFFDANGDPPASYDIINWQLIDGQVQHVTLGHFASDDHGNYRLSIQEEKIVWRTGKKVILLVVLLLFMLLPRNEHAVLLQCFLMFLFRFPPLCALMFVQ